MLTLPHNTKQCMLSAVSGENESSGIRDTGISVSSGDVVGGSIGHSSISIEHFFPSPKAPNELGRASRASV